MSIYDNAGVVLIPSGYKAGTTDNLYSVLPANGDGDFNATRGSSATRVNKDGFIESVATNVPRLDYPLIDGVVQDCPALLLEPQRTNIQGYSESFSNWSRSNVGATENQSVSPDGNLTADFVNEYSGVNNKFIYLNESVTSGNDYTYSVFAKSNGTRYIQLTGSTGLDTGHVNFDLQTGTITLESAVLGSSIEKYPNDWYRISVTLSCTLTTSAGRCLIALINSGTSGRVQNYDGDTSKGVYLWGAQFEISDYPTSYIQNLSSGTTTRSADICNGSGTSAEFDSQSGALFAEFKTVLSGGNFLISIADGTSNTGAVFVGADANEKIYSYYNSANHTSDIDSFEHFNKIVNTWDSSGVKIYINGFSRTISGSQSLSSSDYDNLRFSRANGSLPFYGDVKQVMTFKTKLTDSELETLTSWDSFNAMAKGQLYTIE